MATCHIFPSGPGLDQEPNLALFNHLFASAEDLIGVRSPYFGPDSSRYKALKNAVGRAVGMHLYMGGISKPALTIMRNVPTTEA